MAPDPGLLRVARERGKPQTQPRWVSRVQPEGRGAARRRRRRRVRARPGADAGLPDSKTRRNTSVRGIPKWAAAAATLWVYLLIACPASAIIIVGDC